jgi:hypothetical protein
MAIVAFKTDHPDADVTWHAAIHVGAYFTFFLGLLLAHILLAWGRGTGPTARRGGTRPLRGR